MLLDAQPGRRPHHRIEVRNPLPCLLHALLVDRDRLVERLGLTLPLLLGAGPVHLLANGIAHVPCVQRAFEGEVVAVEVGFFGRLVTSSSRACPASHPLAAVIASRATIRFLEHAAQVGVLGRQQRELAALALRSRRPLGLVAGRFLDWPLSALGPSGATASAHVLRLVRRFFLSSAPEKQSPSSCLRLARLAAAGASTFSSLMECSPLDALPAAMRTAANSMTYDVDKVPSGVER